MAQLAAPVWPDGGWTAAAFLQRAELPTACVLSHDEAGFLLAQCVAGEAEIELLVVDPACRRKGIAQALIAKLKARVTQIVLEVGATNQAAIALYEASGFVVTGRRKGYYALQGGARKDAVTMKWSNPQSHLG